MYIELSLIKDYKKFEGFFSRAISALQFNEVAATLD